MNQGAAEDLSKVVPEAPSKERINTFVLYTSRSIVWLERLLQNRRQEYAYQW